MSGSEGSFVICRVELSNQFARQLEEGLLYQLRQVLVWGLQLPGWPAWTFRVKDDALEMCWPEPLRLSKEVQLYMQELLYVEIARLASLQQEHYVVMELDVDFLHLVSGPNEPVLSMLVRDLGVEINVSPGNCGVVVEIRGTFDAVEDAQQVLALHLHYLWSRPPGLSLAERQLAEEADQRVSIFVDDSNIALGCELLPSGRDYDQRLSIPDFSEVVAGVRPVDLRVVGDLQTRSEHRRWCSWNRSRFWVEWKQPLAACVLGYVKALERHGADRKRSVLALCTSDDCLIDIVEDIARRGWQVEIWCWRATSHPAYEALASRLLEVNICFLDGFRSRITMPCLPGHFPEPVADDDPEKPCIICLSAEAVYALRPCNHRVLCPSCLPGWIEHRPRRSSCPMCRKSFNHMQFAVGSESAA